MGDRWWGFIGGKYVVREGWVEVWGRLAQIYTLPLIVVLHSAVPSYDLFENFSSLFGVPFLGPLDPVCFVSGYL